MEKKGFVNLAHQLNFIPLHCSFWHKISITLSEENKKKIKKLKFYAFTVSKIVLVCSNPKFFLVFLTVNYLPVNIFVVLYAF